MPVNTKNRALGALPGLAVGDALGAPLEFTRRDTLPEVRDLIGGGPFRLKPGEWTDDMSMALCLADSLIACRALDPADLLRRFVGWQREGDNSVTGRCFDIGVTTSRSLARFERSGQTEAGPEDPHQAGNGSLMRLAPVALFAASDAVRAAELAELQSRTTHPAPVAHDACRFFAELLVEAIGGATEARGPADAALGRRAGDRGDCRRELARQDARANLVLGLRRPHAGSGALVRGAEPGFRGSADPGGQSRRRFRHGRSGDRATRRRAMGEERDTGEVA